MTKELLSALTIIALAAALLMPGSYVLGQNSRQKPTVIFMPVTDKK